MWWTHDCNILIVYFNLKETNALLRFSVSFWKMIYMYFGTNMSFFTYFNPNYGALFRGLFCGGGGGIKFSNEMLKNAAKCQS